MHIIINTSYIYIYIYNIYIDVSPLFICLPNSDAVRRHFFLNIYINTKYDKFRQFRFQIHVVINFNKNNLYI